MTTSGQDGLTRAVWRKSSYSSPTSNNCVEVATNLPGIVAVRDSKDPGGGVLSVSPYGWKALLEKIRTAASACEAGWLAMASSNKRDERPVRSARARKSR